MLNQFLLNKLKEILPNKSEKEHQLIIDSYNKKFENYYKHSIWYTLSGKKQPNVRLGKHQILIEKFKKEFYS